MPKETHTFLKNVSISIVFKQGKGKGFLLGFFFSSDARAIDLSDCKTMSDSGTYNGLIKQNIDKKIEMHHKIHDLETVSH